MFEEVRALLGASLQLGERTNDLQADTPLLGNLPELDSMAVVMVLTAFEEHYGFIVEDDEISADTFETLGHFVQFIEQKLQM